MIENAEQEARAREHKAALEKVQIILLLLIDLKPYLKPTTNCSGGQFMHDVVANILTSVNEEHPEILAMAGPPPTFSCQCGEHEDG